jgi:uncharacterized membrane protein YdjX (TVP38/TMEM64 family)
VERTVAANGKWRRKSTLNLILGASLVAVLVVLSRKANVHQLLPTALLWIEQQDAAAPIVFIAVYNLATVFCIPAAILTIGAGVLFGLVWGTVYVLIAATLGAILVFMAGRYLMRRWLDSKLVYSPQFKAIDAAVAQEGFKIVLLTRLSPMFPFNLLNYVFGITQVSFKDYVLGSLGMIPGIFMYVQIGSLSGDLAMIETQSLRDITSDHRLAYQWIVNSLGLVATIAISVYIAHLAKTALAKTLQPLEQPADRNSSPP